jgi:hypothetical protein
MEGQMSTTVERVKEHAQALSIDGQVGKWLPLRGLLAFLTSLASERCVWEEKPDPDFDGAHYYETQCGLLMDDETAYGWFQGDTSHWGNCRCGKRIEVKEEGNG